MTGRGRVFRRLVLLSATALCWSLLPGSVGVSPGAIRQSSGTQEKPKLTVGELPERRTQNSQTRRNEDGSLTSTVFAGPMHYRAGDGSWQPIDSRLRPIEEDGYRWANAANAFRARFRSSLGEGFLSFNAQGREFRLSSVGSRAVEGRVAGSSVDYPGAYISADLHYGVISAGVKEVIRLADASAPASYEFRLTGPSTGPPATAEHRPDGSYRVFVPPLAEPAFVLEAPTVTEAASPGDLSPPDPEAKPTLTVARDGRDFVVRVSVDTSWLRAAGRRFPVEIDPTLTIQPDVEDASFVTAPGYAANVGDHLYIGGGTDYIWRAALQFDLSGVPAGVTVSDARLGLFYDGPCIYVPGVPFCGGTSHLINAHRITAPWSTSTSTSNLLFDSAVSGSYTLPNDSSDRWMSWPITSLVSSWLSGTQPNYGVVLRHSPEALNTSGPVPPGRRFEEPAIQPKVEITYLGDAVNLLAPATLHSNGADLTWTRYTGETGAPFDRYEVHRSATPNFTPGPSTLLTTIRDINITSYRDTTAAPSTQFTYRVVANTSRSNPRTVTLPADGQASTVLQPGPAAGKNTFLYYLTSLTNCGNYGSGDWARVGTETDKKYRNVLYFDLRTIPPTATVTDARLSVWETYATSTAVTLEAHRITRGWKEGTGGSGCNGSGATWYETEGGQPWTMAGGDYDTALAGPTVSSPANASNGFRNFTITSVAQAWVNGSKPNHGLLLRVSDGTLRADYFRDFTTDDYTAEPGLRPKLTVTYTDDSLARGPQVSIAAPGPGATVSGSTVRLAAAAEDDRRVDRVAFFVDGVSTGPADTTAPFELSWNSASVLNGTHQVTAEATDDAGNVTNTNAHPVSITVDNTAPPTGSMSAPANNATVSGPVTVSATASDDVGVARVEFLVDGVRVGAPDTSALYSITWNTQDPLAGIFDGPHQVSAVVTDTSGQQVTTAARSVTVDNRGSTSYSAGFTLNAGTPAENVFPAAMAENTRPGVPVQDPYSGTPNPDGTSGGSLDRALGDAPQDDAGPPPASCPPDAYCPTVTVKNTSGSTWQNSTARVWYRWYAPNGAIMFEGKSSGAFPASFGKNATQDFPLTIYPPALPPGAVQGTYRLRIDVYDPATATWFAARGNPPTLDNPIIIAKSLATKLGLERYYQYDAADLGAGMTSLTNVANGNMLVRWTPFFAPGRGLATMLDLTYNSLEDHSKSPAGNNFSLSISGLTRFGEPLDIHPNKADEISGQSNKWVEFTDGDGTTHRFTDGVTGGDGITRFTEPPGVNLYLRSVPTNPPERRWAVTRPDKVTFYFDTDGFPTFVEDRNGNRIAYTLEPTPPGEDPGGPKKRITRVTDAGGRSFTVDYWSKDEAKKAHVRGNVQRITDHDGSALDFDYYDDGNLLRLTQRGGTTAGGEFLADRSFVFTYTTSSGADPAIPTLSARQNPDPKTANQSTRLYSVRDPNEHETTYAYMLATDGQQLRWRLKSRTDRPEREGETTGQTTSYGYDLTNRVTTVTKPDVPPGTRVTRYTYDPTGKVTRIVNPNLEPTDVEWSSDFKVTKVIEPTTKFTRYDYNANGYPTLQANQLNETTALTYLELPVDDGDTGNHLSLVETVTTPKGVATPGDPDDYQWTFTYDRDAQGNIIGNPNLVTDPTGAVTDYDYNPPGSPDAGTLSQIHDANGNPPTVFEAYDPSGQPTQVRDPLGNLTQFGYDPDGRLIYIQDPIHQSGPNGSGADVRAYRSYFDYDSFGRLGRQSAPKSTEAARGALIWSSVVFDPNDNIVRSVDPHDGPATGDPGGGFATTITYDPMDRPLLTTGPDTSADEAGERTLADYDEAGRLKKLTKPRGVATSTIDDFTTVLEYDPLDRVFRQTEYGTSTASKRLTHFCYDLAGDLRSVTAPNAALGTLTCPAADTTGFTTRYDYDDAHRLTVQTDPEGHESRIGYDANGNVETTERDIDKVPTPDRIAKTTYGYDMRDAVTQVTERFTATRNIVTKIVYDRNGNRTRFISPRGYDAAGGSSTYTNYVTDYGYDALNRLVKTTLPFDLRDDTDGNGTVDDDEKQYVHHAYDANGNLAWTSLPVNTPSAAAVADTARTVLTHYDPGWIRTSDDPVLPRVRFDYTARGQQALRVPEDPSQPGGVDTSQQMSWEYYPDGMLKTRKDRGGQSTSYGYDADNNLTTATDAAGITDPAQTPVDIEATYSGFDQPSKVRNRKQGATNWTFTAYSYDSNGNVSVRKDNGVETTAGSQVTAPREHRLFYNDADWLTEQRDLGTDGAATCNGDQRIFTLYWDTGWEKQRELRRAGSTCTADATIWPKKLTTNWTHFDNGKLDLLTTKNGAGTTTESHDVGYIASGIYLNGNRATDRYLLARAAGTTATTCITSASACDAVFTYDARDRLISHQPRAGVAATTYILDQPTRLLGDTTIRAGNITSETKNGVTTTRTYQANQLKQASIGGAAPIKYWYDSLGNLDCITTNAGTQANCSPSDNGTATNLLSDYSYDYLNRLTTARQYLGGTTTPTDKADYTYDPLDRVVKEVEAHAGTGNDRSTAFTFQGVTNLVTQEAQTGGSNPKTRTYSYDAYGHRISLISKNNATGVTDLPYSYGHDVHGSISQLLTDGGAVKASYGYDAYGGVDASGTEALTSGDTNALAPFNPYRYTGKRLDSGLATGTGSPAGYDMGARRYGPDTTRFLQQDIFYGALANLGLSLDPLTQNPYALAGGNPISYIETDGHMAVADGGGTGSQPQQPAFCATALCGQTANPYVSPIAPGSLAPQPEKDDRSLVGKFFGGAGDFAAGLIGGYIKPATTSLPQPSTLANAAMTPTMGAQGLNAQGLLPSYPQIYESGVQRLGGNPSSWTYRTGGYAGEYGIPAGGIARTGLKVAERLAGRTAAQDIPALVYRGGSAEAKNLTPRPGLDPMGLSTFDNPAAAAPNGGKVQIIDTSRLKCVLACPDAPPPGHVSLQPPDLAEIPAWAATRGTEVISPYTQDIMDAIIGITRVPRP
jgi:RHS repeat-associated protein